MAAHRGEGTWDELVELVRKLRGPDGCPWDRAQTLETLAPFLVEEAHETLHAVENGSAQEVREESGDLAFVLALFLVTAEESGGRIAETFGGTMEKIRSRHPHVFPAPSPSPGAESPEAPSLSSNLRGLELAWERAKNPDAGDAGSTSPALPSPHPALPALAQALKLQRKAAVIGFDWPDIAPVFDKVAEELEELRQAARQGLSPHVREELGDLLFAVVNLARFLAADPESALRRANEKFRSRFHEMLRLMEEDGRDPTHADLDVLDRYWERAKDSADPARGSPS